MITTINPTIPANERIIYWSLGELYVAYRADGFYKQDAWDHLVRNPPKFLGMAPGVSRESNPYRACHAHRHLWRWKVVHAQKPGAHSLFLDEDGNQLSPMKSAVLASLVLKNA